MNPERWQRIESIYNRVLELEPGQRAAYIGGACAGDESLRKEVERLLARQSEAEHFIESPAVEMVAQALAKDQLPHAGKDPAGPVWLQSGSTLLHYRIEEKIGEGGMGEVYRARDERLSRDVAIKSLPGIFAHDPQLVARFDREAKLLASLNHPNIAAIHGLEESDGRSFIVMELIPGQTLAQRLLKGPLPVSDAVEVCRQIAEGLEAAHVKGVIHRDLKPGNVMITADDKVKILDFGLAKALAGDSQPADPAHSPTITEAKSRPGVILGTAAYMSPEQARGKPVDRRADIWAFGCILYECLTGKRAFPGETITESIAKILGSEPDWALLPAVTPLFIRAVLRQCLQKDPSLRLHDIADARVEMREELAEPPLVIPVARRFPLGWILSTGAATLVLGLVMGLAVMRYLKPAASPISQYVVRTTIRLEPGHWLDGVRLSPPEGFDHPTRTAMAISGDGRFIVYVAVKENPGEQDKPHLYLRRFDQLDAKPIAGTEGGMSPFLSPDDRWVGFWADGKLRKVSIDGDVSVTLCDAAWSLGGSWGIDGRIVFSAHPISGLSSVSADGGNPETLTTPDKTKGEGSHRLPHWLPDSKSVLFTIMREWVDSRPRVALLDLKTRKWSVLIEDAADARYVPTGHLVFLRQGTLMAVPFDLEKLQLTGRSVPTIFNVVQALNIPYTLHGSAAGQFSVSDSGCLVYASGGIMPDWQNSLVWMDQKGTGQPVASFEAPFYASRLSPDGQRVACTAMGRKFQVRVFDLNRGTADLLTDEGNTVFVTWTPDGKRVVFNWRSDGQFNLYWQPADGSQPMERLTTSGYRQDPGSFSPDGATLAFLEFRPETGEDILLLDLRNRRVMPFLNSRANEIQPEFSPDGRGMAYGADESGRDDVYVRPYPGPGGKWLISQEGGTEPVWARNGKQLFYRRQNQVWEVDVRTDTSFTAGKPRLLFEALRFAWGWPSRSWDISPDGQRFLMVKQEERKPQPVTEMILVLNWFEELRRLCPTGK